MKYILAVDPGKRNGIALFEDVKDGALSINCIMTVDQLIEYVNNDDFDSRLSAIVVEDYIIGPKGNQGSRGEAIQVIGILRAFAAKLRIPFIRQPPEKRLLAAKWAGEHVRKSHMPDDQSARLHGIYYLRSQGKYTTVLERQHQSDKA